MTRLVECTTLREQFDFIQIASREGKTTLTGAASVRKTRPKMFSTSYILPAKYAMLIFEPVCATLIYEYQSETTEGEGTKSDLRPCLEDIIPLTDDVSS